MLFASLLLANPVVLYVLTGRLFLSLAVSLIIVVILQACLRAFGVKLPTVYAVNVVALFSVFMHGEMVFRARFADYAVENLYDLRDGYYVNKPDLVKHFNDKEYSTDYLTNSNGLRIGYSQYTSTPIDSADWLFIGDSFTQGAQVQFEELFTTLLYRMFPDKIVVNAGISGFGLPEEYAYLQKEGVKYKPRIVFLQLTSFNDFMKVLERESDFSDHLVAHSDLARFLLQNVKYANPAELPLGRWVEPFYPDEESNRRFNVFYRGSSAEKEADLRAFARYLRLFAEAVSANRARLVVLLLPTKEQTRYRDLNEVVTQFHLDPQDLDMQRPNRIVRAIADSLRIEILDLQDSFESADGDVFYRFDEHLTPLGHQVLAEAIRGYLVATGTPAGPTILSTSYLGDRYPSVLQNGNILFHAPSGGSSELFLADSTLAPLLRLTVDAVDQAHPVSTQTGDTIFFTEGDQSQFTTKVVMATVNGGMRQVITSQPTAYGAIPDIASDGHRLVYAEWRSRSSGRGDFTSPVIVLHDLLTNSKDTLSPVGVEAWRPVFSPAGTSVTYIRKSDGQFDLWSIDLLSRRATQLTRTPYDEWDPRYSPDGRSIVYAANATGNWDLFLFDVTRGVTHQVTRSLGNEWDPSFSRDGQQILFG